MKIDDGDTAMMIHALRIAEQMKGSSQNYARVMEYVKRHDALREKILTHTQRLRSL